MQLGPWSARPPAFAARANLSCARRPASPISAKPAAKITAAPILRLMQDATASAIPAWGRASTAASTPSGSSSMEGRQGLPPTASRERLTRWITPPYLKRSRLASTAPPIASGSGDTPTMAMDPGRSSRPAPGILPSALTLIGPEAGAVGFLVEELRHAPVAALLGIEEARLVHLGEQVILGVVPAHLKHPAIGVLGRAQHGRVLIQEHAGKLLHPAAQLGPRHGFVDQAHRRRAFAVERLAGHDGVKRVALVDRPGERLGDDAGRDDAPIDLRQAEGRLVGGYREIAGQHRGEGAAEAPAVHHGDGRL